MTSDRSPRRRRRDAGAIRLNDRDLFALRCVSEHWAVRTDALAAVLGAYERGRESGELASLFHNESVSVEAARKVAARWQRAGLVEVAPILARGVHCWTTHRGLRMLNLDHYRAASPAAVLLPHYEAVLNVRIRLDAMSPDAWISERAIRSQLPARTTGTSVPHIPDGELLTADGRVAIEVELTPKGATRTLRIVRGLLTRTQGWTPSASHEPGAPRRYAYVHYFATPDAARGLSRIKSELTPEEQRRLRIEVIQ